MPDKVIRDPVHDLITFQQNHPTDELLFKLLNAAECQRLRRIAQLGMAAMAYPGADHSRYSHSLGVMVTARKMILQLRRDHEIDEESETILLCAALLHDLGHGPFSHVFERVSHIHHEKLTQRLIADPESDVHQIMARHDRALPDKVLQFLRGQPKPTFLNDILSSQLDADRLDYLLRDNLMSGSHYGGFDLNWILQALTISPDRSRLAITMKGISAAEAYLQSRYHMYRNVYYHKVVRSAEGMVKLALQRARRLAVQDRLEWPPRDQTVYKALLGQRLTISEFTELDDVAVMHCFKLWTRAEDATLASLCRGLLYRKLYKSIDLPIEDQKQAAEIIQVAQKTVAESGGDPAYDLFVDEPSETAFNSPQPEPDKTDDGPEEEQIQVITNTQQVTPLNQHSPLPDTLNKRLRFKRLHILPVWRERVLKAIEVDG